MAREQFWELLACTTCQQELSLEEASISCRTCGTIGQVTNGVLDFQSLNEPTPRPKIYDDPEYGIHFGVDNGDFCLLAH